MSLQEILTSEVDVASLAAMARRGLAWWVDELVAMLPEGWRAGLSSRPQVWIERDGEGWTHWRDSRRAGRPPPKSASVGVLAPAGAVFTRRVTVPRMPVGDLRRMLALDLDRLSPLAPSLIHWDMDAPERAEADDTRQTVLVGFLARDEAAALLARAEADGYRVSALSVLADGPGAPPQFNFLPQVRQTAGADGAGRARLYWWLAVLAMIVLNLGVLVGRDMIEVSRLQATVDAQRLGVEAVQRLRRRVAAEDARRREILARGANGDPLPVIDRLTRILPPTAWVQRLEWNGQRLRATGYKREDFDLAAALRAGGGFAAVRVVTPPSAGGPPSIKPFDLTADAAPERPR